MLVAALEQVIDASVSVKVDCHLLIHQCPRYKYQRSLWFGVDYYRLGGLESMVIYPMGAFILEADAGRIEDLKKALATLRLTVASSYDEAVAVFGCRTSWMPSLIPIYDVMCLDHDLGDTATSSPLVANTGYEFVRWVRGASPMFHPRVFVHARNPDDAEAMARELRAKRYETIVLPFGEEMLSQVRPRRRS